MGVSCFLLCRLQLAYDALNRVTNMVDGVGTTRCSYAANGALAFKSHMHQGQK
jgi:hypothetical protein